MPETNLGSFNFITGQRLQSLNQKAWKNLNAQMTISERKTFKRQGIGVLAGQNWLGLKDAILHSPGFKQPPSTPGSDTELGDAVRKLHGDLLKQTSGACDAKFGRDDGINRLKAQYELETRGLRSEPLINQLNSIMTIAAAPVRAMLEAYEALKPDKIHSLAVQALRGNFRSEWAKFSNPLSTQAAMAFSVMLAFSQLQLNHRWDWIPFHDYVCDEPDSPIGPLNKRRLKCFVKMFETVPYFLTADKLCIIGERPVTLKLDARNRLHCEDGVALAYKDGFEFYAWHGTTVRQEIIEA
ncbi:MAG TPA: hypothetical protein V6C72_07550, partial [Chroococcales cyanobacterium]